jgi:sugar phosphate isomerase/epimerase
METVKKIPIALELYSVRNELKADTRGTLQAVADMGYEGVEFAGMPNNSAEELRSILDETGLRCCGWHTPLALVQDDKLEQTIAFNETLGNNKLIIPGIPAELRQTHDDWLRLADFFNELADKLEPYDMFTGYHNHHIEFAPMDDGTPNGQAPWDTFFGNTKPSVIMQLDNGNAMMGGGKPIQILMDYPGRAVTVHLKPYTQVADPADHEAAFRPIIGEDDVPWQEFFYACETVGGTEWYIVEYESDAYPPLEAVKRCLDALRTMGK